MKLLRNIATAAAVTALALALSAGPAAAKAPTTTFTYFATIDCGAGAVQVGSGDDLYSPLVDLDTGKVYRPVAWHVTVGDVTIDDAVKGATKKHTAVCSYTDGVATGTVTVKKA